MKQVHVLPLLVTIVPAIAQTGAFTYLGCYSDDPSARGLTGQSNAVPADQNSIETCAAACTAYTYFGVEWSVVSLHIRNAIFSRTQSLDVQLHSLFSSRRHVSSLVLLSLYMTS